MGKEFGRTLRDIRERTPGLTGAAVAEVLNILPQAYNHYETGRGVPKLGGWRAVLRAVKATPEDAEVLLDALDQDHGRAPPASLEP